MGASGEGRATSVRREEECARASCGTRHDRPLTAQGQRRGQGLDSLRTNELRRTYHVALVREGQSVDLAPGPRRQFSAGASPDANVVALSLASEREDVNVVGRDRGSEQTSWQRRSKRHILASKGDAGKQGGEDIVVVDVGERKVLPLRAQTLVTEP